ncbi:MAG: hypothetical protein NTZ90_09430 [Proteobacteria bacterium]|nr:hypothetical protein [Pseudomonadota bacterium]
MTACNNYTLAPLCKDANSVVIPGIAGNYTLSMQNSDDYSVQTQDIVIDQTTKDILTHTSGSDTQEARTCQVGGFNIVETFDPDIGAYKQTRLYVEGMGLTYLEVFYDRSKLTADGIASKIFDLPESASKMLGIVSSARLGTFASTLRKLAKTSTGLMIDNRTISSEALIADSYAAAAGLVYLRK